MTRIAMAPAAAIKIRQTKLTAILSRMKDFLK